MPDQPAMEADNSGHTVYAEPRIVNNLEECFFYHVMDLPGVGTVGGEWDLRQGWHAYLGKVDFKDKRVLEVGTASGFLCFTMEKLGAQVVAFDLPPDGSTEIVPFSGLDSNRLAQESRINLQFVNNAFWLSHRLLNSRAKLVHGQAYQIPESIGMVDIAVYGAVLLHLRDPFQALQSGTRLASEKVIVTEQVHRRFLPHTLFSLLAPRLGAIPRWMAYMPDARRPRPETWWYLLPTTIAAMLETLGFPDHKISLHSQARFHGKRKLMFTVVASRLH